jgi:hypothetical protein
MLTNSFYYKIPLPVYRIIVMKSKICFLSIMKCYIFSIFYTLGKKLERAKFMLDIWLCDIRERIVYVPSIESGRQVKNNACAVEIKIKWIPRKQMTHENTYRADNMHCGFSTKKNIKSKHNFESGHFQTFCYFI